MKGEVYLFMNLFKGVICMTKLGPIQHGMPPETVKDALNLGIEIPTYYIVPGKMFKLSIKFRSGSTKNTV